MVEVNNKTRTAINLTLIKKTVEEFLMIRKKKNYEVSIAFIGDEAMKKLNFKYRGKDKTTDVLSFEGEGYFLGEIIINYQQIKRQAERYGNTSKKELIFILVHGLLHLLGHQDNTEKKRLEMIKLGEEVIKKINKKA